jgi:hypothetical protein
MPQDPPHPPQTPAEKDAEQPVGGRQPQRPGQPGKYQPRPGERDAETLPSRKPEGFAEEPPSRDVLPDARKTRRGTPPDDEE